MSDIVELTNCGISFVNSKIPDTESAVGSEKTIKGSATISIAEVGSGDMLSLGRTTKEHCDDVFN